MSDTIQATDFPVKVLGTVAGRFEVRAEPRFSSPNPTKGFVVPEYVVEDKAPEGHIATIKGGMFPSKFRIETRVRSLSIDQIDRAQADLNMVGKALEEVILLAERHQEESRGR